MRIKSDKQAIVFDWYFWIMEIFFCLLFAGGCWLVFKAIGEDIIW
jgi:hypothetical protein